ncbi:NAD-dependent epimerase/dehydratase family protein [Paracoccus aerodenitrificans]|uniref:NAD-dependent epimerase/dehydratase family protein n=1 Tax=Paracoccus aerodenitrificans TaxID=3017781 RepID=UPI003EBF6993
MTGGTGLVGRFIVNEALAAGDQVTVMSRHSPAPGLFDGDVRHSHYDLAAKRIELCDADAVVHAAFSHIPGRYRGGEGDDAEGFLRRNLDGSLRLFEAAAQTAARVVFLSSRAVYGPQPGMLSEDMICAPDTLYGEAKLAAEQTLLASGQAATVLRATGVYGPAGPGQQHKWADLFEDFGKGAPVAPRIGSEVHGDDLAHAVRLALSGADGVYNVSDLLLDRRSLLEIWQEVTGIQGELPAQADSSDFNEMNTDRLKSLGWQPGGLTLLRRTVRQIAADSGFPPSAA